MSLLQELVALKEKAPRHTHHTTVQGNLSRADIEQGSEKVERQFANERIQAERNAVRDFRNCEKKKHFMQNKKLDCKSRKWNHIREYSQSTRVNQFHKQDPSYFCKRRRLRTQYNFCRDIFVLKIRSLKTKVGSMKLHDKNKL